MIMTIKQAIIEWIVPQRGNMSGGRLRRHSRLKNLVVTIRGRRDQRNGEDGEKAVSTSGL